LLILVEGELHFTDRLPELQVGLLDTIEDGVKVGLKKSRKSGYQCHVVCSVVSESCVNSGLPGAVKTGSVW
jgi:hypothetical protein